MVSPEGASPGLLYTMLSPLAFPSGYLYFTNRQEEYFKVRRSSRPFSLADSQYEMLLVQLCYRLSSL